MRMADQTSTQQAQEFKGFKPILKHRVTISQGRQINSLAVRNSSVINSGEMEPKVESSASMNRIQTKSKIIQNAVVPTARLSNQQINAVRGKSGGKNSASPYDTDEGPKAPRLPELSNQRKSVNSFPKKIVPLGQGAPIVKKSHR